MENPKIIKQIKLNSLKINGAFFSQLQLWKGLDHPKNGVYFDLKDILIDTKTPLKILDKIFKANDGIIKFAKDDNINDNESIEEELYDRLESNFRYMTNYAIDFSEAIIEWNYKILEVQTSIKF